MRFLFTVLRIAIAIAIVNAAVRAGSVYWDHYQFEDEAQQLALFGWKTPTDELRTTALATANELQIPITEDQISVTREGPVTTIEASYEQPLEYFPNQRYPLQLSFSVEGRNLMSGAQAK